MRATLILFVMTCLPAFCQEGGNSFLAQPSPSYLQNLKQRARLPAIVPDGLTFSGAEASATCSIPLLNATPPGKPVDMPKLTPPKSAPTDRMQVVAPAPACVASFGHIGAPAPTLPPPAIPSPSAPRAPTPPSKP